MRLSPLYIQKIQEAQQIGYQKGRQEVKWEFVKMLLTEKIGDVPPELNDWAKPTLRDQITLLSLDKLPELAKALLRFSSIDDLALWLTNNQ